MTWLILGANGQLGQTFVRRLGPRAFALTRARADLTKPAELRAALAAAKPDVVVNCAAYNFVDQAETEPQAAFAVNAWGAGELARMCRDLGCVLIHYSTNYVFGLDRERRPEVAAGKRSAPRAPAPQRTAQLGAHRPRTGKRGTRPPRLHR